MSRKRPDRPTTAPRGESLAEHIARIVDEAPPLTESQRARLAAALLGPHGSA